MPLTPFHALSLIWIYYYEKEKIDLFALTISSAIVDLEPLAVLLFSLEDQVPDHGFWHSYFASALLTIPLSVTVYLFERKEQNIIKEVYEVFRIKWVQIQYQLKTILLTTLFGGFSHIFFDMFSHKKLPYILFPIVGQNPFWMGDQLASLVNIFVLALSFYSLIVWYKASKK